MAFIKTTPSLGAYEIVDYADDPSLSDDAGNNPYVAPPSAGPSWSDVGKNILLDIFRTATGQVANKLLGTGQSLTPQQLAMIQAQQRAEEEAKRKQTMWIVGGLAAAVVVGALVLRKT